MLFLTEQNAYRIDNGSLVDLEHKVKKTLTENFSKDSIIVKDTYLYTTQGKQISVYDVITDVAIRSHHMQSHKGFGIINLAVKKNWAYCTAGHDIYRVKPDGLSKVASAKHPVTRWAVVEKSKDKLDFYYSSKENNLCYLAAFAERKRMSEKPLNRKMHGSVIGAHEGAAFVWTANKQLIVYTSTAKAIQGYIFNETPIDYASCGSKVYIQFEGRFNIVDTSTRAVSTISPIPKAGRFVLWENCPVVC